MSTKTEITVELASKVLHTIDAGLVAGMGSPEPGKMCVEAAVCYAMGLPHSDQPTCVSPALRRLKIKLNDSRWSSDEARTKGLRRLGIAQLGSADSLNDVDFVKRVSVLVIQKYLPIALRAAATRVPSHSQSLLDAASLCSLDPSIANAKKAKTAAAYAAAAAAAYADAADAAYAAAAGGRRDEVLSEFGEDVVQILIEMGTPGTKFLYLTETK